MHVHVVHHSGSGTYKRKATFTSSQSDTVQLTTVELLQHQYIQMGNRVQQVCSQVDRVYVMRD